MALEQEMSFDDYVNVVKRKLPYVIAIFFLVFLLAIAYAIKLPPIYESTGTILIESQLVNSEQAKEKYAADRFEALKQIVLSNKNLLIRYMGFTTLIFGFKNSRTKNDLKLL